MESGELRGNGCEYEHEDIPTPIRIRIEDLDSVDPVDPVVLRLEGTGVMWDDTPMPRTELGAKLVDYRLLYELVNERPKVVIVALGDVGFADGIGVLAELSSAGIHEVYLPARDHRIQGDTDAPPHTRPNPARPRSSSGGSDSNILKACKRNCLRETGGHAEQTNHPLPGCD